MTVISKSELTVLDLLVRIKFLRTSLAAAKALYKYQLAPDFNVFDFIRPDEMKLSEILAWLLNPEANVSHAQSSKFFKLFCKHYELGWTDDELEKASVRTEVAISKHRRLDVLIETTSYKCLIIENKPWAKDGENQIKDYLEWAKINFQSYQLIYLGAEARPPAENSIPEQMLKAARDEKTLRIIEYRELLPWLVDCRTHCEADRLPLLSVLSNVT